MQRTRIRDLKQADIDALRHLPGAEITRVCLGPYDIQFKFAPRGSISVQARCELIESTCATLDVWQERTKPGPCRFIELFESSAREVVIHSARSFILVGNALVLRVVDSSDQYE